MELKEKTMQKLSTVAALAVLANLLWGSAAPMIKTGYRLFQVGAGDVMSQILFAGARFFLAGIFSVILGSVLAGKLLLPGKSAMPKICILSLFQTIIQYVFFYIGCAHASGTNTSIATSTSAFICILFSSLVFRQETLTAKKLLGCLLGFAGVLLVNLSTEGGLSLEISLAGEGAIILSTCSFAVSNAFTKAFSKTENPVMLCGYQFILGSLVMIAVSLALGGTLADAGLPGLLIVVYLALVSAVAFSVTSLLVKYNPVSRVSVYNFLNPIFGVCLSILILGESGKEFGLRGLAALALVCLGVFVVNHSGKRPERAA